jgi:putative transposase
MANTYTQLYVQLVFGVKGRTSLIPKELKEELHKYITGIVKNDDCKMLAINSMPDHIHIFTGLHPKISVADLLRDIKANSSSFIKSKGLSFAWQEGYGAFSYAASQKQQVIRYIEMQEEHHRKKSFREEYIEFLKAFNIPYDERYVVDTSV